MPNKANLSDYMFEEYVALSLLLQPTKTTPIANLSKVKLDVIGYCKNFNIFLAETQI